MGNWQAGRSHRNRRKRGQSLVEFALVIPLFVALIVSLAEFSMFVAAMSSTTFATRDAATIGAAAGNALWADSAILQRIETDVMAPASPNQIVTVTVFRAKPDGSVDVATTYTRGGSTAFPSSSGGTVTLPYTLGVNNYGPSVRCNVLSGAGCPSGKLDSIGVVITYQYNWISPIKTVLGWASGGVQFTQSTVMQMEPVQ